MARGQSGAGGGDNARNHARWDDLVRAHLASRATGSGWSVYVSRLWEHHLAAGFANEHFVRELTKGLKEAFFQRVWEMMLGRHLVACGYDVLSPADAGMPDYRIIKSGSAAWVEATCAMAGQDPLLAPQAEWLCSSGFVPHDSILLRWTNALSQKIRQAEVRRRSGMIGPRESYVIAINGGAIGTANFGFGASNLPYVVEATLAVGPLRFNYDRQTMGFKGAAHDQRTMTQKGMSAVPTAVFFDRSNRGIAAVAGIGLSRVEATMLPLLVAHNPNADCPFPTGQLGDGSREWAACLKSEDKSASYWEITEVSKTETAR